MMPSIRSFAAVLPFTVVAVAACSSRVETTAPAAADDDLRAKQSYSPPGTTMTLSAGTPEADSLATDNAYYADGHVRATMTWTGSGTYKTGACLLNHVFVNGNPVTCSSDSGCSSYNTYTGGSAHCRAPNNGTAKTCWVRPGPASTFCVGTPGDGLTVTAPTTKTSAWADAYGYCTYTTHSEDWIDYDMIGSYDTAQAEWMLDGCYQGCATTSPSDSSLLGFYSTYNWDYRAGGSVSDQTWVSAN